MKNVHTFETSFFHLLIYPQNEKFMQATLQDILVSPLPQGPTLNLRKSMDEHGIVAGETIGAVPEFLFYGKSHYGSDKERCCSSSNYDFTVLVVMPTLYKVNSGKLQEKKILRGQFELFSFRTLPTS